MNRRSAGNGELIFYVKQRRWIGRTQSFGWGMIYKFPRTHLRFRSVNKITNYLISERSLLVDHPNVTQRRRTTSSSKLASIFGKEAEAEKINALLNGINDLAMTGKLAAKTAESQRRGAEQLARWAHSSRNTAIDDVMQQTHQLFSFFADKQAQFARDYDHFLQVKIWFFS